MNGHRFPDAPPRIKRLPVNDAGYPVPWFVWMGEDGRSPDFRVIAPGKIEKALMEHRCWVCGQARTGPTSAFVIGPMCAVNRVSAEPPSHRDCAVFSAKACPFLVNPKKRRREGGVPEHDELAGVMLSRNPGVALVWITANHWRPFVADGGVLFDVGEPLRVLWFAEGREATRAEVMASIDSGYPSLLAMAEQEGDDAVAHLERLRERAMPLVPA